MIRHQHIAFFISILVSSFQASYYNSFYSGKGLFGQYQFKLMEKTAFRNTVGIAIGFCLSWPIGNMLGRKPGLIWSNAFLSLAILFYIMEFRFTQGLCGTFLGIHAGTAIGLNLIYIFEISPRHSRGMRIASYFMAIRVSMFLMEIIVEINDLYNFRDRKQVPLWVFSIALILSVIHIYALILSPELPDYIAPQNDDLGRAQPKLIHTSSSSSPLTLSVLLVILSSMFQFVNFGAYTFAFSYDLVWARTRLVPEGLAIIFMLISIRIFDKVGRRTFLFGTIAAILTTKSILIMIVLSVGDNNHFLYFEEIFTPEFLIYLLSSVDIELTNVGIWMIAFIIILEMGDQEARARRLVLSQILSVLIIPSVFLGIATVRFIISGIFEVTPLIHGIKDLFIIAVVVFLLVGIIWKKIPETGGMAVEEISQQI